MKSVRLGREREDRLCAAARADGITTSEFIRRAVDRALEQSGQSSTLRERLQRVIGTVHTGGGVAHRASEAFAEMLYEDFIRQPRR